MNLTLEDFNKENESAEKRVGLLAQFLFENFQDKIGENTSEGAIEMAVRLLLEYKKLTNK